MIDEKYMNDLIVELKSKAAHGDIDAALALEKWLRLKSDYDRENVLMPTVIDTTLRDAKNELRMEQLRKMKEADEAVNRVCELMHGGIYSYSEYLDKKNKILGDRNKYLRETGWKFPDDENEKLEETQNET